MILTGLLLQYHMSIYVTLLSDNILLSFLKFRTRITQATLSRMVQIKLLNVLLFLLLCRGQGGKFLPQGAHNLKSEIRKITEKGDPSG